jgi:hypothetical protein
MEFVLCIRFAFIKFQTAPFTDVARLTTNQDPSPKTADGKEENGCVPNKPTTNLTITVPSPQAPIRAAPERLLL